MMKFILFFFLFAFCISHTCAQSYYDYQNDDRFRTWDLVSEIDFIGALESRDGARWSPALKKVLKKPDLYNPRILFIATKTIRLWSKPKKENDKWAYVAQLRARIDSNTAIDTLHYPFVKEVEKKSMPAYSLHAQKDPVGFKALIEEAITYVETHEENYDKRWIFYDAEAKLTTKPVLLDWSGMKPKEEWPAIKKQTIADYRKYWDEWFVKLDALLKKQ